MKRITVVLVAFACIAALLFSTCKKETTLGPSKLSVRLKDAPAAWEKVKVEIKEIRLLSEVDGWVVIPMNGEMIDILQLRDTSALLATVNLHAGTISEVHLVLGTKSTITAGGITFMLTTVNGDDDDVMIKVHEVITGGGTFVMILDLKADQSIDEDSGGNFHLHGVLSEAFEREHDH